MLRNISPVIWQRGHNRIWCSQVGSQEELCLLRCNAVQFVENQQTSRRKIHLQARNQRKSIRFGLHTLLWSSGQSSWLQIWRSRVRFPGTTGGKKVVGLERGPLSLVSTTEELLGRNSSGSGLEIWEYCRRGSSRWLRRTLYPQKVGTNFAVKRRSLGRYSSLADWGHRI
jgi:hypothetical protein